MGGEMQGGSGAKQLARVWACALTASLIVAGPVLADARADAKRHFRDGMQMIASGQVERGIAELKQAYAIKPHPDVLYDIAKAYVDLGNIPEALVYFRQYVATDPEDKDQVTSVMQRLQAAISPGAPGVPVAPQTPGTANAQNAEAQRLIAQLQALIAAQGQKPPPPAVGPVKPGTPAPAKPAANAEDEMFEESTISAQTRATAQQIASELAPARGDAEDIFEEQVVTASARTSSETRAPASLTVITEDEIRMSGAATIPEILRRVPGVDVAEMNPSDTNISFRGFNRRLSNKVLVLVDGRSVYEDFLGGTFWPLIDVSVPDIQRIEVIRGPGSALYGANAFAGVINIITKSAAGDTGVRLFGQGGTQNNGMGGISVGARDGRLSYRTTIAYDRADKWTKDVADGAVAQVPQFSQVNRSRETERADSRLTYDFGKTQVTVAGGYDDVAFEVVPVGALRTFEAVGQTGFARLEIDSGATKIKGFWNAQRLNAGPEYAPEGIASLQKPVRSDVIDFEAQTGFDFKGLGTHHLDIGAGYRFKGITWDYLKTHDGNSVNYTENHFNAFLQEDWAISKKVSLVVSYRIDRDPLLAQENVTTGGLVQSPRGTLLYELQPEQVLRLTVGTAFRVPTFLESYADLFAGIPNQPALGVSFQGDPSLKPEEMLQAELGYRGRIGTFQPDVVVYAERVSNLITDGALQQPGSPAQAIDPRTGQFIIGDTGFENEPDKFFGIGAEIGGKWSPAEGLDLIANYSFEKLFACTPSGGGTTHCTSDTSIANQTTAAIANTAEHKLNFTALWRTKPGFDLGVDVHYVSSVTWVENSFDVTKPGGVLFTAFPIDAYTMINGKLGYRFWNNKLEAGVAVYNLLGDDHRENPFGEKIGRRVLFTAAGSF
jgi:outer membrane receptor for ferrienterochelin and colicin